MARTLILQIRLSKEEHKTISTQADREGLGVGTYLRSLALRTALGESTSSRGRAFRALLQAQERSKARGIDKLSSGDINAEIKAVRRGRRRQ